MRDTAQISTTVVLGSSAPPVKETVEAILRAYNRLPHEGDLAVGDLLCVAEDASGALFLDGVAPAPAGPTIQTKVVSTGIVVAGGRKDIQVAWPSSFAKSNYAVSAVVVDTETNVNVGVRLVRVRVVATGYIRVIVENEDSVDKTANIHAMGVL